MEKFISFELIENKLYIILKPYYESQFEKLNKSFLKSEIIQAGYGNLFIFDDILDTVINEYFTSNAPIKKIIGEKRDAEIKITVSDDKMKAWIEVIKPYGGQKVNRDMLEKAIESAGIKYGIKPEVIDILLEEEQTKKILFAEGFPPTKGKDAYFELLFELPDNKGKPKIKEDGSVDYYDLGIVVTVDENQPLMRKHPPQEGIPGINVLGEEIPALPGNDKSFAEAKGSYISPDDPNLLLSKIAGQPIPGPNYVKVEPVFTVNDVDQTTGNIVFKGDVLVNGIVQSGFSIKAGGNIKILGTVEAAKIEAGGSIELKAGVIGQHKAKIIAKNNIYARFVENAYLEAGKSVFIDDILIHSQTFAKDRIEVGMTKTPGKGQIVGGICKANSLIKAKIAGALSSTNTVLEVGLDPYIHNKLSATKKELEASKKKIEEVVKNLIHLKVSTRPDKEEFIRKLEEARNQLLNKVNELTEIEKSLSEQLNMSTNAKIIITKYVYSGVKISISDVCKTIKEDLPGGSFELKNGEIVIGPVV